MTDTDTAATLADELAPVLDDLADLLGRVRPDQADDPTPCSEYTVAELRQHIVGWLTAFTDGFEHPSGECSDPDAVPVIDTGAEQVRALAARLRSCLARGAGERPLVIGGGEMPGPMALAMILGEYQVHGWDLARATGNDWGPREAGLQGSLEFLDGMLTPDWQGPGKSFDTQVPVPSDAPALAKLVARTGRDPEWGETGGR